MNIEQQVLEGRIQAALTAVANRIWINGSYEAQTRVGEPDGPIARSVLPYRVYKSKGGNIVVDGYDTYRNTVRTFRLDRFLDLELADALDGEAHQRLVDCAYLLHGQIAVAEALAGVTITDPDFEGGGLNAPERTKE